MLANMLKRTITTFIIGAILFGFSLEQSRAQTGPDYHCAKGRIPRKVLENYLSRAITLAEFCTGDDFLTDGAYPYREDDVRMLQNTGARFIGRAVYSWGAEHRFADPMFWTGAGEMIGRLHKQDKDLIIQACIIEIVTTRLNEGPIPYWVFYESRLAVDARNFNVETMLNLEGKLKAHWKAGASVPDVTRRETTMGIYFLARKYIDIGVEAIHFGQIHLMGL